MNGVAEALAAAKRYREIGGITCYEELVKAIEQLQADRSARAGVVERPVAWLPQIARVHLAQGGKTATAAATQQRPTDWPVFEHAATPPVQSAAVVPEASHADALCASWLDAEHPDDRAITAFEKKMREKMAASRAKGRSGWDDPAQCSAEALSMMLREHVEKGDPVDVANFCMVLSARDEPILGSKEPTMRTIADMAGVFDEGVRRGAAVALAAVQSTALVPEGWKLVPVEPTEEMVDAAYWQPNLISTREIRQVYERMLASAPAPADSGEQAEPVATLVVKREFHDNGQGPRDTEGFMVALAYAHASAETLPIGKYSLHLAAPAPAAQVAKEPLTEAQIEKGREDTFSTNNPFCPCDSKTMRKAVRWAERAHGIGTKEQAK